MTRNAWECPDCGTENELDPAVVDFCVDVWESCEQCGSRYSIKLAGESG